jgi:site-specific recombinase XerD
MPNDSGPERLRPLPSHGRSAYSGIRHRRHTFAINYLRKGSSVFQLQKVLGHSSLEMTRRYANLLTEDLQAIHERISLLAA